MLYNAVLAVQAIGWVLVSGAAVKNRLTTDEQSTSLLREGNRNGHFACGLYSLLAVAALWLPTAVASVTTASWIFWLVWGIRMKPGPAADGAA